MLDEYKNASNMTDQFAALVALDQKPGETRDEVLADFYTKWQHDYLVSHYLFLLTLDWLGCIILKGLFKLLYTSLVGCQQMVCSSSHVRHSWQSCECSEPPKSSSIRHSKSKQRIFFDWRFLWIHRQLAREGRIWL